MTTRDTAGITAAAPCDGLGLPDELLASVLSLCGGSLGAAACAAPRLARACARGDPSPFEPLAYVAAAPAPGLAPRGGETAAAARRRQADAARARRGADGGAALDWRALARAAAQPAAASVAWRRLRVVRRAAIDCAADDGSAAVAATAAAAPPPSHRHSVATCGAPAAWCESGGGGREAALLFGGNVSRSVAGSWATSAELLLAVLPGRLDPRDASLARCEVAEVARPPPPGDVAAARRRARGAWGGDADRADDDARGRWPAAISTRRS